MPESAVGFSRQTADKTKRNRIASIMLVIRSITRTLVPQPTHQAHASFLVPPKPTTIGASHAYESCSIFLSDFA
jgi:hypothetical protein